MDSCSGYIIRYVFLFCMLFAPGSSFAQDADTADTEKKSIPGIIGQDFRYAFDDAFSVAKGLTRLDWNDAAVVGGVIAGTALIYTQDQGLREFAQEHRSSGPNRLMDLAREYGNGVTGVAIGGTLYLGGLVSGSDDIRTTGRLVIESLALAGALTTVLKISVGRARPYTELGTSDFRPFRWNNDFWSFPSGHTTTAFAVSSVLAARIDRWWASAGLYTIAGLAGYSRMYHDAHWASDVFLGGAIGTLSGLAITHIQEKREKGETYGILYPVPGGVGVAVIF